MGYNTLTTNKNWVKCRNRNRMMCYELSSLKDSIKDMLEIVLIIIENPTKVTVIHTIKQNNMSVYL